jgi:hypothetical protein
MGSRNHEGRRHLEIVRSPEELPEDERVIEAYAQELLTTPDGTARPSATVSHSPFQHDVRTWTSAYFLRGDDWYQLNFYEDSIAADCVMSISMKRFSDVFPNANPPKEVEWLITRSEKLGPTRSVNDPAYFRAWLEGLWGPLPDRIQHEIGVSQTPRPS